MCLNRNVGIFMMLLVLGYCGCNKQSVSLPPPNPPPTSNQIQAMAEEYMDSVVQITAGDSFGTGFIVGEHADSLFVATANHVVESDPQEKIHVRFYKNSTDYSATLRKYSKEHDFALLEVKHSGHIWEKKCYDTQSKKTDYVWFIGKNQKWYVSLNPGIIDEAASRSNSFIKVINMPDVQIGTSGAPLFNKGIIGMIKEDSIDNALALDIGIIEDWMKKWNLSWNLVKCQEKDKPLSADELDKIKSLLAKADAHLKNGEYLEPEKENAYDAYREVLKSEIDNKKAQKGILDILNVCVTEIDREIREKYTLWIKDQQMNKDVKADIIKSLNNIIKALKDSKRICEEYPQKLKDDETRQRCASLDKKMGYYEKKRSEYEQPSDRIIETNIPDNR